MNLVGMEFRIFLHGVCALCLVHKGNGGREEEREKQWKVRNVGAAETLPHGVHRFHHWLPEHPCDLTEFHSLYLLTISAYYCK